MSQLKGGPFGEKNFRKKSHNAEKLKGDPLEFFNIHSVAKQEIEGGIFFGKMSHNAEKLKGGTLWDFPTSILTQNSKKIEGENFPKKVSQCRKKLKEGTLWSRPVWYATRKNRKNLFGSVR